MGLPTFFELDNFFLKKMTFLKSKLYSQYILSDSIGACQSDQNAKWAGTGGD